MQIPNKYVVRTDLPKLYRTVYAHVEWITDKLVNGEHEQECGTDYVRVMRVLSEEDHTWKWLIVDKDIDLDIYQRAHIDFSHWPDEPPLEWSGKRAPYDHDMEEDEKIRIKIDSAVKDNRTIKQKMADEAERKAMSASFLSGIVSF